MIPLKDNVPSRTTPFVNYLAITICCVVFLNQAADRTGLITLQYGLVPARISDPQREIQVERVVVVQTAMGLQQAVVSTPLPPAPIPAWGTLLSCVFLHGSLMHLLGNMWFLYIFGDNVEDRLGHLGYLVFFPACGVAASIVHFGFQPDSTMPTIGASGAVAGVMGAYLLLYPHAMVLSVVPILFFVQILVIPAPIFLGLWFVMQLMMGTFSVGDTAAAGVAWWAHVGGFVAGLAATSILLWKGSTRPAVTVVRPGSDRITAYRLRTRSPWSRHGGGSPE